jgi:hypothetical protein
LKIKSTHIKRRNQSTANIREGKIRWIVYKKMKIKGREKNEGKKGSEKPGREKKVAKFKAGGGDGEC